MLYTGQAVMEEVNVAVSLGNQRVYGDLKVRVPGGTQGNVFIGNSEVSITNGILLRCGDEVPLKNIRNVSEVYCLFTSEASEGQTQRVCWYFTGPR